MRKKQQYNIEQTPTTETKKRKRKTKESVVTEDKPKRTRIKKSSDQTIALVEKILDEEIESSSSSESDLVVEDTSSFIEDMVNDSEWDDLEVMGYAEQNYNEGVMESVYGEFNVEYEEETKIEIKDKREKTRRCYCCGEEKPLSEFNYQNKGKDQKMYLCKACEKIKKKDKNDKRKSLVNRLKIGGCVVCGESEPCCLDYHHIDSQHKEFAIGSAHHKTGKKILQEIAKCVVVCSNCHRKIHNGLIDIFDYINPSYYKFLRLLIEASQDNVHAQEQSQGIETDD